MRLLLVRHGAAYAGLSGTIAGVTGCRGLTELGLHQAELLRQRFAAEPLDDPLLFTSRIPRAIQTAHAIAPALGVARTTEDCDLCEVHTGDADGTDWADYDRTFGQFDMIAEPDRRFAPGGDSWHSFHERVARLLTRLAAEHPGRTLVAATHAGVIAASLRVLFEMPLPRARLRIQPENTSITEWHHDADTDTWMLRSYNDHGHLFSAATAGEESARRR